MPPGLNSPGYSPAQKQPARGDVTPNPATACGEGHRAQPRSSGAFYVFDGGRAFGISSLAELANLRTTDRGVVLHGLVGASDTGASIASGALLTTPGKVYVSYHGSLYPFRSLAQLSTAGYGGTAPVPVPGPGGLNVVSAYSGL